MSLVFTNMPNVLGGSIRICDAAGVYYGFISHEQPNTPKPFVLDMVTGRTTRHATIEQAKKAATVRVTAMKLEGRP